MTKAQRVLAEARKIAATDVSWSEFSNALFDPYAGIVAKTFPSGSAHAAFMKTPEYRAIRNLLQNAMERTGVIAGATPRKSGKFVVRVSPTLHWALDREAKEEGVSLNQLVVTKLSVGLKTAIGARTPKSRWKSGRTRQFR